jgi:polyhydroxyalkanoate synthesis repressor PhaR
MSEIRIIKKYPNRRLYDTAISSYITLEDVRRLVVEEVAIKVIDARTQEDITHSTLLQIIIEQEENGPGLFSIDSLQKMIQSYGGGMQGIISSLFEQSMVFFKQQHNSFKKDAEEEKGHQDPVKFIADLTQKNWTQWQDWQHQWLTSFGNQQQQAAPTQHYTDEKNSFKEA